MNRKRGSSLLEVIFIVVMLAMWILPFAVLKLWWWFWMFTAVGVVFGIFEALAALVTGKTLSQQFWKWSTETDYCGKRKNVGKALIVLACMGIGWIMLLIHLAWKMLMGG